MTPTVSIHGQIDSAIQKVQEKYSSRVARIGYSLGEDSVGYPAVFFRVLMRDGLSKDDRHEVTRRLPLTLINEALLFENGLWGYCEYRTEREQREMREPRWEK